MHKYTLICCCCLLILLSACGGQRKATQVENPDGNQDHLVDGEAKAQELVNLFKQADTVVFSVYIVYQPPKRDHLSFSVTGWAPNDERLRIRMTKIGVDFLEGILNNDGSFTGVMVRDKRIIKGHVNKLVPEIEKKSGKELKLEKEDGAEETEKGAPLITAVDLLRNEIKHGPINIRQDGYKLGKIDGKHALYYNLPHKFTAVAILGSRKKRPVEEKIIYNPKGKEVMRLQYDRLKEMDGLRRMSQIKLILPNSKDKQTIIIREIDVVRRIAAQNMHLDVPNYRKISIEDFGKKVTEKDSK